MNAKRQQRRRSVEDEPRYVVGMDAHSKKLAVSIWDWSDRFNACLHREIKCVDIEAMVKTYERHVDLDSITIIEASTNSANLKRMLNEAGYRAEVVRSDTIADKERKRRVCDIVDAENLALAYIKGDVDEFVWTPSDKYAEYRDIMFAYRDTSKEVTRASNRIWSVCSRKAELSRKIAEAVLANPRMLKLMQLQGVNYKGAFALEAAVEDPRRFSKASKLAAYGGFSPIVDSSGDEEERAKRNGGLHKPLDGEGRQDVKFFFTEAGQSVLTSCGKSKLGKWGWAMINRGKPRNKVACAIGRKLITYGWHIMRGDPTPNRDSEAFFKRKMRTFHQEIGAKRMHELGLGTRNQFADAQANLIYGNLPESEKTNEDTAVC